MHLKPCTAPDEKGHTRPARQEGHPVRKTINPRPRRPQPFSVQCPTSDGESDRLSPFSDVQHCLHHPPKAKAQRGRRDILGKREGTHPGPFPLFFTFPSFSFPLIVSGKLLLSPKLFSGNIITSHPDAPSRQTSKRFRYPLRGPSEIVRRRSGTPARPCRHARRFEWPASCPSTDIGAVVPTSVA